MTTFFVYGCVFLKNVIKSANIINISKQKLWIKNLNYRRMVSFYCELWCRWRLHSNAFYQQYFINFVSTKKNFISFLHYSQTSLMTFDILVALYLNSLVSIVNKYQLFTKNKMRGNTNILCNHDCVSNHQLTASVSHNT